MSISTNPMVCTIRREVTEASSREQGDEVACAGEVGDLKGIMTPTASFVTRLKEWNRRPLKHKIHWIKNRVGSTLEHKVHWIRNGLWPFLLTPVFRVGLSLDNRLFRSIIFDISHSKKLLIRSTFEERFIVLTSDKVISKSIFTQGSSYDFRKFETVIDVLGKEFSLHLLIDVGANIGTICIPAVRRGFAQQAIAFEPEPDNFSVLMANIYINGLANSVTAHNIALGSKDNEKVVFELSENNGGDHRVFANKGDGLFHEMNRKTIEVNSETLNKIVETVDAKSTLIWMDTQGYEGHILSGATKALELGVPMVLEFWPYGMLRSDSYLPLKNSLLDYGYKHFYNLDDDHPRAVLLTNDALDNLYQTPWREGSIHRYIGSLNGAGSARRLRAWVSNSTSEP